MLCRLFLVALAIIVLASSSGMAADLRCSFVVGREGTVKDFLLRAVGLGGAGFDLGFPSVYRPLRLPMMQVLELVGEVPQWTPPAIPIQEIELTLDEHQAPILAFSVRLFDARRAIDAAVRSMIGSSLVRMEGGLDTMNFLNNGPTTKEQEDRWVNEAIRDFEMINQDLTSRESRDFQKGHPNQVIFIDYTPARVNASLSLHRVGGSGVRFVIRPLPGMSTLDLHGTRRRLAERLATPDLREPDDRAFIYYGRPKPGADETLPHRLGEWLKSLQVQNAESTIEYLHNYFDWSARRQVTAAWWNLRVASQVSQPESDGFASAITKEINAPVVSWERSEYDIANLEKNLEPNMIPLRSMEELGRFVGSHSGRVRTKAEVVNTFQRAYLRLKASEESEAEIPFSMYTPLVLQLNKNIRVVIKSVWSREDGGLTGIIPSVGPVSFRTTDGNPQLPLPDRLAFKVQALDKGVTQAQIDGVANSLLEYLKFEAVTSSR